MLLGVAQTNRKSKIICHLEDFCLKTTSRRGAFKCMGCAMVLLPNHRNLKKMPESLLVNPWEYLVGIAFVNTAFQERCTKTRNDTNYFSMLIQRVSLVTNNRYEFL